MSIKGDHTSTCPHSPIVSQFSGLPGRKGSRWVQVRQRGVQRARAGPPDGALCHHQCSRCLVCQHPPTRVALQTVSQRSSENGPRVSSHSLWGLSTSCLSVGLFRLAPSALAFQGGLPFSWLIVSLFICLGSRRLTECPFSMCGASEFSSPQSFFLVTPC